MLKTIKKQDIETDADYEAYKEQEEGKKVLRGYYGAVLG